MLRIAARNRMILELAESSGKRHVRRRTEILIPQKHNTIFEQCRANLGEQLLVVESIRQLHTRQFGAQRVGQLFDMHHGMPPIIYFSSSALIVATSRNQHRRAGRLSRLEHAMRVCSIRERKSLLRLALDLAIEHQTEQLLRHR